jgi:hypothetical protein
LEFFVDLFSRHFVQGFDGNARIFGAEFEEVNFTTGFEGGVDGLEHFGGVGELVISIDEEDGINGVFGKLDRIDGSEVSLDVGDFTLGISCWISTAITLPLGTRGAIRKL